MAFWDAGFGQVRDLWSGLTAVQRAVLIGVTLGLFVGLGALLFWAGTPEYGVLYAGLPLEDAADVAEQLRADGVPFRLEGGGRTVLVPADKVYDLRLSLAGQGIPKGGVVGFEIFDRSGFGMTDFAQKVNYTRALEGELTRTIRGLDGVDGVRVHLVMPERRLFESEAKPASASVVLQLRPGRRLTAKQVRGIVHLVASSVEGLEPDGVTVVDSRGTVLYQSEGDAPALLAASQLEYKRAYEKDVERRVRELLERVTGPGGAVVRVAAEFDFSRVQETSEVYDPEAVAVRSEERVSESSTGPTGPAGVPGMASNVPGSDVAQGVQGQDQQGAGATPASSSRETETVNYEVSKTVRRVEREAGALKRLSVAVAVDGTYKEPAEEGGAREFVPRPPEELDQIRALVEKAVGADPARGDAVEVTSIPFHPAEVPETKAGFLSPALIPPLIRYGTVLVVALLGVFFVARPLLKVLGRASAAPEVTGPITVAEMEQRLGGQGEAGEAPGTLDDKEPPTDTVRREELKKRLQEMVDTEPEIAANLVRSWMSEE